jgi:hypothetical protein
MSFYPFMVKTNTGRLLTYNGITQFASTGEIKGKEIIEEVDFSYDRFDKIMDVSSDEITFIIGKWDDKLQDLFNQYTQELERKTAPNIGIANSGADGKSIGIWSRIKQLFGA